MQLTRRWALGPTVAVLIATGCASPLDSKGDYRWLDQDLAPARRAAALTTAPSETFSISDNTQSPRDYVLYALTHNPKLAAAVQQVEQFKARIAQAAALDDPMLTVAPFGEFAETAAGRVQWMGGVSQKFPLSGKLNVKQRAALADASAAWWRYQQMRRTVAAQVRSAYWSYHLAISLTTVTEQSRALLGQLREISEARYRAGAISQADLLRLDVELADLQTQLAALAQRRHSAQAMLNQLLDRPIDAPLAPPTTDAHVHIPLSLDELLAKAQQQNPRLAERRSQVEAARHRQKLAGQQRIPDLTVSLNYAAVDNTGLAPSANGDDQWWVGFGMNLPIWAGKLKAAEDHAFRAMAGQLDAVHMADREIAFAVSDALGRIEAQQQIMTLIRDNMLPQARQAVEVSISAYRAGRGDFLAVIDHWRKQLQLEVAFEQSFATLQQELARLHDAVGGDPTDAPAAALQAADTQESNTNE